MRLISRIAPIRYDIRGGTVFLAPEWRNPELES